MINLKHVLKKIIENNCSQKTKTTNKSFCSTNLKRIIVVNKSVKFCISTTLENINKFRSTFVSVLVKYNFITKFIFEKKQIIYSRKI